MYLTARQLRILELIRDHRVDMGISPTLEEIAKALGVTKITIYEHINQLERKGAIKREKFRARSIELACEIPKRARQTLPLIGEVAENGYVSKERTEDDVCCEEVTGPLSQLAVLRVASKGGRPRFLLVSTGVVPQEGEQVIVHAHGSGRKLGKVTGVLDRGFNVKFPKAGLREESTREGVPAAEIVGVVVGEAYSRAKSGTVAAPDSASSAVAAS